MMDQSIIFSIDGQRYALNIAYVDSAIPAVELQRISSNTTETLGMLNLHGTLIPVLDAAARLGHQSSKLTPSHQIIVCEKEGKRAAFVVDQVIGLEHLELPEESPIAEYHESQLVQTAVEHHGQALFVLSAEELFSMHRNPPGGSEWKSLHPEK